jgi:subtilisin family serine protease
VWARSLVCALVIALAVPASAAAQVPSEQRQDEQWAVRPGAVLRLPDAWRLSQGAGVVVAVIDSGTRLDHPDLAPNAWVNFGEVPGNGADDDRNGYVDDVHGVDLTTTSAVQDLSDGNGHGTHVAGIIAGASNGRGIVGVAFRARIMTVKVLKASGAGTTSAVAEGIRYAAANGARVINLSLGGDTPDERVREAIAAAAAANVLVVCSAGNSGRNIDAQPSYPVSFAAPNLIGVAATAPASGRQIAGFSNFGRTTVALAAPGEEVLSTTNDGGYGSMSGTSMAAPHVSGVAALMAAAAPALTAAELRAQLLQNAVSASIEVGSGYLDALGSVRGVGGSGSISLGQPPRLRVLQARRSGRGSRAQTLVRFAIRGATDQVRRHRVVLDGRKAGELAAGPKILTMRKRGVAARRAQVIALDSAGRPVAKASARVRAVRMGKRDVDSGSGVGTGGGS